MTSAKNKLEIVLIRHTAVAVSQGLCYGQLDVPLAASFMEEAQDLRQRLCREEPWHQVVTSPLARCQHLAQFLGSADLGETPPSGIKIDHDLQELSFGLWEGKLWDDIPQDELNPWMEDFVHHPPPGGETMSQLALRAQRALARMRAIPETAPATQRILCITHAGVIRALLGSLLEIPLKRVFQLRIDHGSRSSLEFSGDDWSCTAINRR